MMYRKKIIKIQNQSTKFHIQKYWPSSTTVFDIGSDLESVNRDSYGTYFMCQKLAKLICFIRF